MESRPTTLIESLPLSSELGLDVVLAVESFQHTGSFKYRAALQVARNISNPSVIASSSGNFGQAIALATRVTGRRCTVVMPETASRVKIEGVKGYGANVDLIDTRVIKREDRVAQLAVLNPEAYLASPYDDPLVIQGNSTLGHEIASVGDFDAIIAPIGGGGLCSGLILGLCDRGKTTPVFAAEPAMANDAARSLKTGRIVANEGEPPTLADGARTRCIGRYNWEILRDGLAGVYEVSEENIKFALRILYEKANLKVEPTAALSVGAVLQHRESLRGKSLCLVVTGGNVDAETYARLIR